MKHFRRTDEKGMVAMIVTLVMMIVITLIVLGFSESTRRNQREAVDTQLGLQAYYAAESGVNDITGYLKEVAGNTVSLPTITNCNGINIDATHSYPKALSSDGSVANTCLMVDPTPPSLIADSITATSGSVVWHVKAANISTPGFTGFNKFKFSWEAAPSPDPNALNCNTPFKTYPVAGDWGCARGLLRVDIIKRDDADLYKNDAANLAKYTATLYLQPGQTNGDFTLGAFGGKSAYQGACVVKTSPSDCTVTVTLDPAAQSGDYYMRITSMYADAKSVTLRASDNIASVADFSEGQVLVDSTGRAQDQLKRISVRIPLTASSKDSPVYAVQGAGSICKDMTINTGQYLTGACTTWPN